MSKEVAKLWRVHTNYGSWHCEATESQIKAKHDEYIAKWLEMIEHEKKDGRDIVHCHQPCEATFIYSPMRSLLLLDLIKLPSYQPMPTKSGK